MADDMLKVWVLGPSIADDPRRGLDLPVRERVARHLRIHDLYAERDAMNVFLSAVDLWIGKPICVHRNAARLS